MSPTGQQHKESNNHTGVHAPELCSGSMWANPSYCPWTCTSVCTGCPVYVPSTVNTLNPQSQFKHTHVVLWRGLIRHNQGHTQSAIGTWTGGTCLCHNATDTTERGRLHSLTSAEAAERQSTAGISAVIMLGYNQVFMMYIPLINKVIRLKGVRLSK